MLSPDHIRTRSGRRPSQHPAELYGFVQLLRREKVRSYLEIGARHGDTFYDVMRALPKGSVGHAVDLPGGAWGNAKSVRSLERAVESLARKGYKVGLTFGDSQASGTKSIVGRAGPFDACLIDGDHRYDGVKADWETYRRHARIVAFHDIAGEGQRNGDFVVEVPRLWREIEASGLRTQTFVAPGSPMGIGVVWCA